MIRTLTKFSFLLLLIPLFFLFRRYPKYTSIGLLIGVLSFLAVASANAAAPSSTNLASYDFLTRIDIRSTSALSNQWIPFDFPVNQLVTNSFIAQADADDILSVDALGTFRELVGQGITGDANPTFWVKALSGDIPADNDRTFELHTGESATPPVITKDYPLGLLSTDSVTVPDDATLDIVDDLVLRSDQTILDIIPGVDTHLINKNRAYTLGIRNSNEVFGRVYGPALVATDSTANNNDGTVTGATLRVPGQLNEGADFDGTDDEINFGSDATLDDIFAGGGTIEFWVEMDTDATSDVLVSAWDGVGNKGWRLLRLNDNFVDLIVEFSGTNGIWSTTSDSLTIADGLTHVAVTYDSDAVGNNPLIFFGGSSVAFVEQSTPTGTFTSSATEDLLIGEASNGGNDLDGLIDDLRAWDDIRTPTEIADNRNIELVGTEANLQGYWMLNRESVTVSHSPIVVDTLFDFRMTFDNDQAGDDLRLFVDDVEEDTAVATFDLPVNTNTVDIGPFSGEVHRTRIGDTDITAPTLVLDFTYEPDTMAETDKGVAAAWTWTGTITDQSADTNDGTFSLVRTYVADLTISVGSPELKTIPVNPDLEDLIASAIGDFDAPDDLTADGAVSANFPFADVFNDAANGFVDVDLLWLFFMGAIAYVFNLVIAKGTKTVGLGFVMAAMIIFIGSAFGMYAIGYSIVAGIFYFGIFSWNRNFNTGSM